MIAALSRLLMDQFDIQFVPGNGHIRCLTHVLNLVVQKLLSALDEADDPDVNDYFDKDLPIHYDVDKDEAQIELEEERLNDGEVDAEAMEEGEEEDKVFMEVISDQEKKLSPVKKVCYTISYIVTH